MARDRGGLTVDTLYGLMQSYENKLGGGEGIEGLYGSITQASMQKVLECLKRNSGLDSRSVFIDIGAGLGRPLLHAMVSIGVGSAWGVELDRIKCDKAAAFCRNVIQQLVKQELLRSTVEVPSVICSPVEKVASLEPATHAYSFWEGVPPSGKEAFGKLFVKSRTLRAVAVVQRAIRGQEPAAMMRDLGFGPVLLIASFPVKMSGSGRAFTAYIFTKITPAAANFLANVARPSSAAAARTPSPQHSNLDPHSPNLDYTSRVLKSRGPELSSPLKTRKPEEDAAQASPAKKPCAGVTAATAENAEAAVKPEAALAPGRAKAVQQVLLTSLPEYSRRTKQAVTAKGKSAGGKDVSKKAVAVVPDAERSDKAPAMATRSSQRLAAKVEAQKLAVLAAAKVDVR
ncbi:hypothetical protein VaNZ11_009351 [Volvox africanus]|uniref:DOT1 domain-containing protein n=1 Tax=Volvox africanus TaxID=51714 RepID=A0ABQ5S987_9CHLO|nr:hypothetical protein VaNZ11_009351 [Volvox africanus]